MYLSIIEVIYQFVTAFFPMIWASPIPLTLKSLPYTESWGILLFF